MYFTTVMLDTLLGVVSIRDRFSPGLGMLRLQFGDASSVLDDDL